MIYPKRKNPKKLSKKSKNDRDVLPNYPSAKHWKQYKSIAMDALDGKTQHLND